MNKKLKKVLAVILAVVIVAGADISTMAIEYAPTTPKYNPTKCAELGITPLEGYEAIEVAE